HREMRPDRMREVASTSGKLAGARPALSLAGNTAATFTAICLLWALWSAATPRAALALASGVRFRPVDLALLLAVPAAIGAIAVAFDRLLPTYERRTAKRPHLRIALSMLPVAALAIVSHPRIAGAIGPRAHRVAITLRSTRFA